MPIGKSIQNYMLGFLLGWIITQVGCITQNSIVCMIGLFIMTVGFVLFKIYQDIKYHRRRIICQANSNNTRD